VIIICLVGFCSLSILLKELNYFIEVLNLFCKGSNVISWIGRTNHGAQRCSYGVIRMAPASNLVIIQRSSVRILPFTNFSILEKFLQLFNVHRGVKPWGDWGISPPQQSKILQFFLGFLSKLNFSKRKFEITLLEKYMTSLLAYEIRTKLKLWVTLDLWTGSKP